MRNILGTKNLHEILSDRESISADMQVIFPKKKTHKKRKKRKKHKNHKHKKKKHNNKTGRVSLQTCR